MSTIEIWRTAIYDGEVYEGYEVSNLGRVKSLNYRRTGKERVMEPGTDRGGYLKVGLRKNKETKTCYVHRLVATAFLDNPENKPEINHIDENKENNLVENIEWCTREENNNYGTRNERAGATNRIVLKNGKLSKPVLQLSLTGELIREWPSIMECGRNGFNQGAVCSCCNGKLPHYKKFLWQYK